MSSGNLQIGAWQNGAPSFINQGQVDWIAFGNTVWSASSAVLQRFASAGIQPITFGAAIALANKFRLSRVGRQRMNEALSSLRGEYGFGRVLYFGFGYRSFVNIMADTQLGVNCIALCASLCQSHGAEFSAHILTELWRVSGFPDEYEPSHFQFLLLLEVCSGVLVKSTFDDTVNLMLGDELKVQMEQTRRTDDHSPFRASGAPDIAKVLHSLFEISTGNVEKITVAGGAECAFVAAFAEWTLGLRTRVEGSDGNLIFTNSVDDGATQLAVYYQSRTLEASIELTGTVHHLKEPAELFRPTYGFVPEVIIRTPWSDCLSRTFGSSFKTLMAHPDVFGAYLGGLARLYKAYATEPQEVARCLEYLDKSRNSFNGFVEASYGQGFVHSALAIFPELAVPEISQRMQQTADFSVHDALEIGLDACQNLSELCQCLDHGKGRYGANEPAYCLEALIHTICHLVVQLACAVWDPGLRPAVAGLLAYHQLILSVRPKFVGESREHSITSELLSQFPFYMEHHDLINDVSAIFDGESKPHQQKDVQYTALSRNGVCYYLEALKGLSSRPEAVRLVHILPGHIQRDNRRYDSVQDGETWFSKIPVGQTEAWTSPNLPPPMDFGDVEVKAMAVERSKNRVLQFYYMVTVSTHGLHSTHNLTAMLQPCEITRHVLQQDTASDACSGGSTCGKQLAGRCFAVRNGWRFPRPEGEWLVEATFYVWNLSTDIARCLALEAVHYTGNNYSTTPESAIHIRRQECLPCSTWRLLMLYEKQYQQTEGLRIHII